ncbi:MAG: transcription antitermination factor NusB [Bacteroidales bacterium]
MTYDLYHLMMLLLLDVADLAGEKIEIARQKKIPSDDDLNPNRRFVDNMLLRQLSENRELKRYATVRKLTWSAFPELTRKIYSQMVAWDEYRAYMDSPQTSFGEDKKFVIKLMNEIIAKSEDIESVLEELCIYWNDDLDFVLLMIEKTFRSFKASSDGDVKLMSLYKNEEDEKFARDLLMKAIIHYEEYTKLIDSNTTNWEIERIALMDTLVMLLAITEIVEFDEIPVKVTLNEYIEIAKYYCTAKSGIFVNGILDKVVREMRDKKMFTKKRQGTDWRTRI